MSRWRISAGLCLLAAGLAIAQTSDRSDGLPPPFEPKAAAPPDKSEMPPEEDKTDAPKVYSFNPVQSQSDVAIGNEYFRKGNYTAAASRYEDATKWNDGNAVAWRSLGEAQEKKSNAKAARAAYQKYLELSPDAKDAAEIKKRLAKLKG